MSANPRKHQYFDGKDHRFPNFSELSWFQCQLESAACLARERSYSLVGPEHLLYTMLFDPAFRSIIKSAGGDPDACRKSLELSFDEHARLAFRSDTFGLSDALRRMIEDFKRFTCSEKGNDPESVLTEFYYATIRCSDGSMSATAAIHDCGGGSLLMNIDDTDFIDELLDPEFIDASIDIDLIDASLDEASNWLDEQESQASCEAFAPSKGNDQLKDMVDRINKANAERLAQEAEVAKAAEEAAKARAAEPAKPAPGPELRRKSGNEPRKEEDTAAEVEACLRNLGDLAAHGDIDPVFGREGEIETVINALYRRRKSSVLLVGDAGVGKTAIAEGLAMRLRSADIDPKLGDRPIYELSIQDLVAGTRFRGDFEARLQHLISRMKKEHAILFVDEFHMIVGAGAGMSRGMDGANMLKTALGRGEITIIGATTPSELRELRKDAAMMRRFEVIQVDEPDAAATLRILQGCCQSWLDHHGIEMADGALESICHLADLYIPERHFPDKAFDLLDMACVISSSQRLNSIDVPYLEEKHVLEAADRMGLHRPRPPSNLDKKRIADHEEYLLGCGHLQPEAADELNRLGRAALLNLNGRSGVRADILLKSANAGDAEKLARGVARNLGLTFLRLDLTQAAGRASRPKWDRP
jgi:ATP-dependent Clp protease ATP-binding subunit ClpA